MVRERLEPSREVRLLHNRDSNCRPRSVTMVDGTPNREIQPLRKPQLLQWLRATQVRRYGMVQPGNGCQVLERVWLLCVVGFSLVDTAGPCLAKQIEQ